MSTDSPTGAYGRTPAGQPETRAGDVTVNLLHEAAESMPQGIIIVSEPCRILYANAHACAILGYVAIEVVGRSISGLISVEPEELWQRARSDVEPALIDAGTLVMGTRKDGRSVPLKLGVSAVSTADPKLLVVSIVDRSPAPNVGNHLSAAHHRSLAIQRLTTEIAMRLVTVPPDQVDATVVEALGKIVDAMDLDRALIVQRTDGSTPLIPTHCSTKGPAANLERLSIAALPWIVSKLKAGEAPWFASLDDVPDPVDRATLAAAGCSALAVFPVAPAASSSEDPRMLIVGASARNQGWSPSTVEHLRLVSLIIGQALDRRTSEAALRRALEETCSLRDLVANEQRAPRQAAARRPSSRTFESVAARHMLGQVELVAPTPATVLLLGETGSGKEVIAHSIHDLSPRRQRPMIRVSCAAIPSTLIESELFGRERGAYTGALSRQIGRFEAADRSTLFLDEIGDLPAEMQVKLLRVLQDQVFERLGSSHSIKVDVRIIAATNRNLEKAVEDKAFREDLYYRLNVFPIVVPPLRERVDDIPSLVWGFVDEFSKSFGRRIDSIDQEAMRRLQGYHWPGNIRELRNVVERAVIVSTGPRLEIPVPKPAVSRPSRSGQTLEEFEADHIRRALESSNWRVRGPGGAAARLGLKPTTLESRMARLGIKRTDTRVRVA